MGAILSRPLIANKKRESEANEFHRRVFARWGNACFFCGCHATDAMHVVDRSKLGKHTRYCCPEENGRPGCRTCHDKKIPFPIHIVRAAVTAINAFVDAGRFGEKCKLRMP